MLQNLFGEDQDQDLVCVISSNFGREIEEVIVRRASTGHLFLN